MRYIFSMQLCVYYNIKRAKNTKIFIAKYLKKEMKVR